MVPLTPLDQNIHYASFVLEPPGDTPWQVQSGFFEASAREMLGI
jgi:hypothetical protein